MFKVFYTLRIQSVLRAYKLTLIFLLLISFNVTAFQVNAVLATQEASEPYKSAILVEAETGRVLFEKDMHKSLPSASMTKMMLMLIVMEKLTEKAIRLDDKIMVSAEASRIGGSQVYLRQGEIFTLEELMQAIAIHSANDACYTVAEHIIGQPDFFVDLMNERAKKLGMNNTHYYSLHGLPPTGGGKEDVTSTYDSTVLARKLVEYPKLLEWTSTKEAPFRGGKFILRNTNKLIGTYRGADGIKTGFYSNAGFNLTATARRGDTRFIAVVMGALSNQGRAKEVARLMDMGFNLYHRKVLLKKGEPFNQDVSIIDGTKATVKLIAAKDLVVYLKRNEFDKVVVRLAEAPALKAPLKANQEAGKIVAKINNEQVGMISGLCPQDVPEAGFLRKLFRKIVK
jgi:D-alanyl-D-alanine carboxypeptidase (penicillin-binding protein 5/6)